MENKNYSYTFVLCFFIVLDLRFTNWLSGDSLFYFK
nr:MAG TPA: hypothetical protein [Bacteriophage sp.]